MMLPHAHSLAHIRNDELLEAEVIWAAGRPCSLWECEAGPDEEVSLDDFMRTLTQNELGFLSDYEQLYPNGIYSLNQNPDVTCMGTDTAVARLHTISVISVTLILIDID